MNISSNTLFHYTRTFDYLKSIISNGFEYRKITEKIPCVDSGIPFKLYLEMSHSAICFCDIPLSLTSDHINQYGEYSIGLTKEWAIKNGVSPIRYIHEKTADATNNVLFLMMNKFFSMKQNNQTIIEHLVQELIELKIITQEDYKKNQGVPDWCKKLLSTFSDIYYDLQNHVIQQSAYYRIYEGSWIDRKDGKEQSRVFYDEREWRAIKRASTHLSFEMDDISKIIVKEESEVEPIIETLKSKFSIDSETERRLIRKIFTHNDIFKDI